MAASFASSFETVEPRALADVFRAEGAFVLRTIRRLGASPSDAEDLTQQVFLVLHRREDLLASGAPIRSVLFGVLRRVLADHRKSRRRAAETELQEVSSAPEQERAVQRSDARAMLERALDALDEKKREVFVLSELEEMSMPEVATTLGVPLQTAYTRLHAARDAVRRVLSRGGRR